MKNRSGQVVGIRLLLLRDYLCAHASKTRAVSRGEIEAYLASKGYPMERKTIYSDLLALETEFGLQLEYNQSKHGYILKNPPFEPYELRLMVDGVQSSKFITAETADRITSKIRNLADTHTRETLNRQAYVADRVRSMNDSVVKDADRIHEAIAADRKIAFRYYHYTPNKDNPKSYSKSGEMCIVSPYKLMWSGGNYYLYAYLSEKKKFLTYRVDRMERISPPLLDKRDGKEEYSEKNLSSQKVKVFDMYHGTPYDVRLRATNRIAHAVIDQFGKDIIMIPDGDHHFTTTVTVEISPPFFAWIATFGRSIKILSPEPVIQKMKEFLNKAAEMYEDV